MTRTRNFLFVVLASVLACLSLTQVADAQTSGATQSITPLTRDLGSLKTTTLVAASTVTSADQNGFNVSRVVCVFNMSAHSGTPSTTFAIQNYDPASNKYYALVTSGAVTADATPTLLAAGAGVATTANVGAGVPIAKTWRVAVIVAGSATPLVTSTTGCSVQ